MRQRYLKYGLIFLSLLFMAQPGYAQTPPPVRAEIDRTEITENDLIRLSLIVETESDVPRVTTPDMDKFTTVRTSRGDRMTITNGVVSRQYTYLYWLKPTETGQLTIESFEVVIDGQTYITDPIAVAVVSGGPTTGGSGTSPGDGGQLPSKDFFVEVEIDNPNPYLGEQVVYTHRLYTAFNISQPNYDFPRFTGFWYEEDPFVTNRYGRVEGRRFNVRESKVILFPTRAGTLQIDETVITSRSSLFSTGFVLESEPLVVEVKPLPEETPDEFEGAVGLFTIEAEVSNNVAQVDEPITLLAKLTGQGNISTAPDPIWPDMPEWRVFDAQANTFTDFRSGKLIGQRVYERLMVPGVAGRFMMPPISYTYFDPEAEEFRTVRSEPIEIMVEPGSGEAPPPVVIGANKEAIERIGSDIRFIKPAPLALASIETTLVNDSRYWAAWGLPIVLLALNFIWSRRQSFLRRNVDQVRSAQAHRKARRAIAAARKETQDLYIVTGQILTTYLTDKLYQPVVGLTQDKLAELLQARHISAELIAQVSRCLTECDMGRFGPGGSTPGHAENLLDRTEDLIADLEKALEK